MSPSTGGYRLSQGGVIDRSTRIRFSFDGKDYSGHPGDTLASALIANGVTLIARSFKYHRPRGFYGVGVEDPNSMLAVRDAHGYDPALRAGQVRLVEGLEAHSVSGNPSPRFDVGSLAQLASGILGAGFYYKSFIGPSWRRVEPLIRRATGFGRPHPGPDRRGVEHRHASCDVLIIGAGPAGLWTASALRGSGLRVLVADDQPEFGGCLRWEDARVNGQSALSASRQMVADLAAEAHFTLLPSTVVTAAYESNCFTLVEAVNDAGGVRGERHWTLRARHVVLASGMLDRPLLFEGNDRPGIMLSSAVRRLIGEFAVAPARRLAIYTNNDSGYLTAIKAHGAGIDVAGIIDTRPAAAALHLAAARALGIECHLESQIETTRGYRRLSEVVIRSPGGSRRQIRCDGLANSGGWMPVTHLAAHRGIKPEFDEVRSVHVCHRLPAGWSVAGGASATLEWDAVAGEAERIALAIMEQLAAGSANRASRHAASNKARRPQVDALSLGTVTPLWVPLHGSPQRMWVDLQNDVKVSDITLAAGENYRSVEHLKRYTTLGMGTDQGRTSNVNGLAVLAHTTGRQVGEVGTTTFRPPFTAVRMATIANGRRGALYQPRRYLPADAVHKELDAVMEDFGWERPDWYRCNGKSREAAVAGEMRAVREHVGVFDSSSLGKIEITGPDAAQFLSKFYVSNLSTLKPGRIRYSVMLRDDGTIFDDGVVSCLSVGHYLASPTSGNAELVAAWFERWRQTEWPWMRVAVSPVTSEWAAIAIAGPAARELLTRLEPDFDASAEAFTHMELRESTVAGVRARVARISFTGELQYEIAVPARYGAALLQSLMEADGRLTPRAVGLEAWLRLRLEKGYLHLGSDTNGRTTPLDVGMSSIVSKRQDDFIGKRSLQLPFAGSLEREQLVGLTALDGELETGGRILAGAASPPCRTDGYVTSACYSPSAQKWIGLALLERGFQREGEIVSVYSVGRLTSCRVCKPVFYDPQNERLRA
jgi:sarcosine oxidase, subunit alpha